MRPDDDETLLGELRRVMGDADPVPDHVVAAAELALDWRTIDDELAELLHDSSELAAGVRAESGARMLSFGAGGLTIELEVAGEGAERTLTGQLDPPARARIEVRHAGGTTVRRRRRARPLHRARRPGRHREPALPGGTARRGHAVASALTDAPPAALAAEAYRVVVDDPERARALAGEALRRAGTDAGAAAAAHRALGMAALELDDAGTAVAHLERAVRAGRRGRPAARGRGADVARARAPVGRRDAARARRGRPRDADRRRPGPRRAASCSARSSSSGSAGWARRSTPTGSRSPASAAAATATARRARCATAACSRPTAASSRPRRPTCARAETLCDELGLGLMRASVCQNLGFVAAQRGDVPLGLARYEQAQATFAAIGGTRYALLELDRCALLLAAGLTAEARASADRAIAALVEAAMGAEVAEARLQRAEVALAERDWPAAREAAGAALRAFTAQRRPTWAALARDAVVRADWGGGADDARLLAAARRAAAGLERSGWTARAVHAHLLAGRVALALGRPRAALRDLDVARRARLHGPASVRIAGWHAEALRHEAAGDADAALRAVGGGLRALAGDRAALGATELRAHAAAQAEELADLGLRHALGRGRPATVLALVERARAQTLHLAPVTPPRDPALAARLGELRAVVALAAEEVRAGRPAARLVARQTRLEHEIRRRLLQVPGTAGPAPRPGADPARAARGARGARADRVSARRRRAARAHRSPLAARRSSRSARSPRSSASWSCSASRCAGWRPAAAPARTARTRRTPRPSSSAPCSPRCCPRSATASW